MLAENPKPRVTDNTEFPSISVDPRVEISRSESESEAVFCRIYSYSACSADRLQQKSASVQKKKNCP